mmetsp:Transcript_25550/g.35484  ORF Transcript_25550/g.35484 Transcript_25550/m.35484 type:complete len:602 (+) Transcript_25550:166-1971(+)
MHLPLSVAMIFFQALYLPRLEAASIKIFPFEEIKRSEKLIERTICINKGGKPDCHIVDSLLLPSPHPNMVRAFGNLMQQGPYTYSYIPNGKPAMLQMARGSKYFEVVIQNVGRKGEGAAGSINGWGVSDDSLLNGVAAVGYAPKTANANMLIGLDKGSFGIHSDDLRSHKDGRSRPSLHTWRSGDVLGVGIDEQAGTAFYTWNGVHMGVAHKLPSFSEGEEMIYPSVSLAGAELKVSLNYGPTFSYSKPLSEVEMSNQIFQRFDKDLNGRLQYHELKDVIIHTTAASSGKRSPLPYPSYTHFCRLSSCPSAAKGLNAHEFWSLYDEGYGNIKKDWSTLTTSLTRPSLTKKTNPPSLTNQRKTRQVQQHPFAGSSSSSNTPHSPTSSLSSPSASDVSSPSSSSSSSSALPLPSPSSPSAAASVASAEEAAQMAGTEPDEISPATTATTTAGEAPAASSRISSSESKSPPSSSSFSSTTTFSSIDVTLEASGYGEVNVRVDGGWSDWSECTKSCGWDGMQKRTCTEPPPSGGGRDCLGPKARVCNRRRCLDKPVWSKWTPCSRTCGVGVQFRTCLSDTLGSERSNREKTEKREGAGGEEGVAR